jgi:hypothetical protein
MSQFHQKAYTAINKMIRRWEKYAQQFDETYGPEYYDQQHKFANPIYIPDDWEEELTAGTDLTAVGTEERHDQLFYNSKFTKFNNT